MAIDFTKSPTRWVLEWAGYRHKKLGGKTGAASGVRRIDPETGEVIETISRTAIRKRKPVKNAQAAPAATGDLEAKATAIIRQNPEKKKQEKTPKQRSKREIRAELSRLRKARKA
ncbi:hypothetical protein AMST5_01915 [freshwater sediment metagenome]|uniref:Uncharacterized protein n=1 Tax=freshwater sediment metagenome TaxID=556182 RepID=A0AA48RAP5_9ZZZZ